MSNLTKCVICGEKYNYCPNCAGTNGWRLYTDTHEHYQIFTIFQQYNAGVFTKEDARKAFEKIGITVDSDLSGLKPNIVQDILDIITVDKKPNEEKTVLKKAKKSKLYKE